MSISNRHSVVPFVSGESVPFSGQRLAKVGYKAVGPDKKQKLPSICLSVPALQVGEITENIDSLLPHIKQMIQDVQDKVIKSLYESSEGQLSSVSDEEISVKACIGFLEAESEGGRLTRESVLAWFKGELEDNLTVYIAEKLGFNDPSEGQMKQIEQHVNGYREVFASLSGGATQLAIPQIKGCKKALELVAGSDTGPMVEKLGKRLEAMEKPVVLKELLEL